MQLNNVLAVLDNVKEVNVNIGTKFRVFWLLHGNIIKGLGLVSLLILAIVMLYWSAGIIRSQIPISDDDYEYIHTRLFFYPECNSVAENAVYDDHWISVSEYSIILNCFNDAERVHRSAPLRDHFEQLNRKSNK